MSVNLRQTKSRKRGLWSAAIFHGIAVRKKKYLVPENEQHGRKQSKYQCPTSASVAAKGSPVDRLESNDSQIL